jgi:sugar lactone lactonase YvrE
VTHRKYARGLALLLALGGAATLVATSPSATGDFVADRVLGQFDFVHSGTNITTRQGLFNPFGVAIDRTTVPNRLYVADTLNHRVLAYSSVAALATGALPDMVIGQANFVDQGCNRFAATPAADTLCFPAGMAIDTAGNLFVADSGNSRVLVYFKPFDKGVAAGIAADLVVGQGSSATNFSTAACAVSETALCSPRDVALDSNHNLYVADTSNNRIIQFADPISGIHDVTGQTVFGQGATGTDFAARACADGGSGHPAVSASGMCTPFSLTLDSNDDLYVADIRNNRVLEYSDPFASMTPDVTADKVFGQGAAGTSLTTKTSGVSSTAFSQPVGVQFIAPSHLLVADNAGSRVLNFEEASLPPTTFTANIVWGRNNATDFTGFGCNAGSVPLGATQLCGAVAVDVDSDGRLYVSDDRSNRVMVYDNALAPNITANRVLGQVDFTHVGENITKPNGFHGAVSVAIDESTLPAKLYAADSGNDRVLGFQLGSGFSNGELPALVIGQADFVSRGCNRNVPSPTAATLCEPNGVAVDGVGNLWISDTSNSRALEYDKPFDKGMTANIAAYRVIGQPDFTTDFCPGINDHSLCRPLNLALDSAGDLYVAEGSGVNRVIEFNAPLSTGQSASLVFGQGASGTAFNSSTCNLGGESATTLCRPAGIALDPSDNLYVADQSNNRVLEYDEASPPPTNATASLVFGQGSTSSFNTAVPAGGATGLNFPADVASDSKGNLFVSDEGNNRVVEFDNPRAPNGVADRVFGQGAVGSDFDTVMCDSSGGPTATSLCFPDGIALDSAGDLIVADAGNVRVVIYDVPVLPTPTPVAERLKLSPKKLSLGTVAVGKASKIKHIKLQNAKKNPLPITIISAMSTADFTVSNQCPNQLPPNGKCSIGVTFHPTAPGVEKGTVTIVDNATGGQQIVPVSGKGK